MKNTGKGKIKIAALIAIAVVTVNFSAHAGNGYQVPGQHGYWLEDFIIWLLS